MKFLIQTIDSQIKHDFAFTLIRSIEYQNWLGRGDRITYLKTGSDLFESERFRSFIPIGSVEFVTEFLQAYYNCSPKPKNIPDELLDSKFSGRTVFNGTEKDIFDKMFVKSNDKIKSFGEICNTAPPGNYQLSDVIEIDSEWRVFVYQGKLVGLQNYAGDFTLFPSIKQINRMIETYKTAPIAYTLDVGLYGGGTVIIEVHDFFSCGLYGFADHRILPFMFSKWFNEFINGKNKS